MLNSSIETLVCYSAVGDRLEDGGGEAGERGERRGGRIGVQMLMKLLWVSKTKTYHKKIW